MSEELMQALTVVDCLIIALSTLGLVVWVTVFLIVLWRNR